MTHGSTDAARTEDEPRAAEQSDEHDADDPSPATSARFRIEIDAFGRVVPKVVPVDEDDASSDASSDAPAKH